MMEMKFGPFIQLRVMDPQARSNLVLMFLLRTLWYAGFR